MDTVSIVGNGYWYGLLVWAIGMGCELWAESNGQWAMGCIQAVISAGSSGLMMDLRVRVGWRCRLERTITNRTTQVETDRDLQSTRQGIINIIGIEVIHHVLG